MMLFIPQNWTGTRITQLSSHFRHHLHSPPNITWWLTEYPLAISIQFPESSSIERQRKFDQNWMVMCFMMMCNLFRLWKVLDGMVAFLYDPLRYNAWSLYTQCVCVCEKLYDSTDMMLSNLDICYYEIRLQMCNEITHIWHEGQYTNTWRKKKV